MIGAIYANNTTHFTVWAPKKKTMFLHIIFPQNIKIEMAKDAKGYFTVEVKEAKPGWRYYYRPNDEKDVADVASYFQPEDTLGPSEVVDHSAFQWNDEVWKGVPQQDMVFSEIHVGTFTKEGTFEAIIPYLDDIADTGINVIELMPVCQFSGSRNWGYDGAYPYAVQLSYGGPEGLKKLVNACHQRGIAVFLDVVYNHIGPEGNNFAEYAPYFSKRYSVPWGTAINFDDEYCDGVREYFSKNAIYWFDVYHIDGLRLDAVHEMYDRNAINFWQILHNKIKLLEQKKGRRLYIMAESDFNSPKVTKHPDAGGMGFDAQWLDDFHHILYVLLDPAGQDRYGDFKMMEQLAKVYTDGFIHSGEYVEFRKRTHGSSSAGVPGYNFLVFNMNHDQIGNRVGGERLSMLVSFEKQKLAAAALMLSPYIPMLFMGEEYGEDTPFYFFVSHHDKNAVKAVQEGRRREFEKFGMKEGENFPDPAADETFTNCILQWNKRTEGKYAIILAWNKMLIGLRRNNHILNNFNKSNVKAFALGEEGLVIHRQTDDGREHLFCCLNLSGKEIKYTVPPYTKRWKKLLDSKEQKWMWDEEATPHPDIINNEELKLKPFAVVVYTT